MDIFFKKIFFLMICLFFFLSSNSFGFDLGDVLNSIGKELEKGVKELEQGLQQNQEQQNQQNCIETMDDYGDYETICSPVENKQVQHQQQPQQTQQPASEQTQQQVQQPAQQDKESLKKERDLADRERKLQERERKFQEAERLQNERDLAYREQKLQEQEKEQQQPPQQQQQTDVKSNDLDMDAEFKRLYSWVESHPDASESELQRWQDTIISFADKGHSESQRIAGNIYFNIKKDITKGLQYYKMASKQGNGRVSFELGLKYAKGDGVPRDMKEVVKWFKIAADQGLPNAQLSLGTFYEVGGNVEKDLKKAKELYQLALSQGRMNKDDTNTAKKHILRVDKKIEEQQSRENAKSAGIPDQQNEFVKLVSSFSEKYKEAKNDIKKSIIRKKRAEAFKSLFGGKNTKLGDNVDKSPTEKFEWQSECLTGTEAVYQCAGAGFPPPPI